MGNLSKFVFFYKLYIFVSRTFLGRHFGPTFFSGRPFIWVDLLGRLRTLDNNQSVFGALQYSNSTNHILSSSNHIFQIILDDFTQVFSKRFYFSILSEKCFEQFWSKFAEPNFNLSLIAKTGFSKITKIKICLQIYDLKVTEF